MPVILWGGSVPKNDHRRLKRAAVIAAAMAAFSLLLGWGLKRAITPVLPGALQGRISEDVRLEYTQEPQDAFLFRWMNYRAGAVNLKDQLVAEGGWKAEPTNGPGSDGWFLRSTDPASPILNVQIDVGRYHSGPTMYYYDHPRDPEWAEGWSAVMITYRPGAVRQAERYLTSILPEKLGRPRPKPLWTAVIRADVLRHHQEMASSMRAGRADGNVR